MCEMLKVLPIVTNPHKFISISAVLLNVFHCFGFIVCDLNASVHSHHFPQHLFQSQQAAPKTKKRTKTENIYKDKCSDRFKEVELHHQRLKPTKEL